MQLSRRAKDPWAGAWKEQKKIESTKFDSQAVFRFPGYGNGELRQSSFEVRASLDDALAILRFYAERGDDQALQMLADLKLGAEVRKLVDSSRAMQTNTPTPP